MKRNTKYKLIIALTALAAVSLLVAGCGETKKDDFIKDKKLVTTVTYMPNGGTIDDMAQGLKLYYPDGVPIINLSVTETTGALTSKVTRENFLFDGWYYAVLEDGAPVFVDAPSEEPEEAEPTAAETKKPLTPAEMGGEILLSDVQVDFSAPLDDSYAVRTEDGMTNWYLGVKWMKDVELEYRLGGTLPITVADEKAEGGTRVIQPGELLKSEKFNRASSINLSLESAPISSTDSTYTGEMFLDAACTQPSGGIVQKPTDGVNAVVYAEYISGLWEIVKTSNDVADMLTDMGLPSRQFYVYRDIAYTGTALAPATALNATIRGNGHTITGLKCEMTSIKNNTTASLLGVVGATASVKDLTFKDVTVTYGVTGSSRINLYGVAEAVAERAVFENFKFEGLTVSLTLTDESYRVSNIAKNADTGEYDTTHWLFGGGTTDAEFLAAHSGIMVTGHLTINGEAIV